VRFAPVLIVVFRGGGGGYPALLRASPERHRRFVRRG
jgi:hypothetical protein